MVPVGRSARRVRVSALAGLAGLACVLAGCTAPVPVPAPAPTERPSSHRASPAISAFPSSTPPAQLLPPAPADLARVVLRGGGDERRALALPASGTGWAVSAACTGPAGSALRWSVSAAHSGRFLIGSTLPCGGGASTDLLAAPLPATRVVLRLQPQAGMGHAVVAIRRGA